MTSDEPRALDVEVHRKVMGRRCEFFTPTSGEFGSHLHGWYDRPQTTILPQIVPHYSTDISAAWSVVELHPDDTYTAFAFSGNGWSVRFPTRPQSVTEGSWREGKGETMPLAICRAALLALNPQA